jgi:hypothetical protein
MARPQDAKEGANKSQLSSEVLFIRLCDCPDPIYAFQVDFNIHDKIQWI